MNGIYTISHKFKKLLSLIILTIWSIGIGPLAIGNSATVQGPKNTALDLVFLIDNSGSMKHNDPGFITPQIVRTFFDKLSADNQVSMVLFDGNARLLMPLTPLTDPQIETKADKALSRIDYRGQHTNTPVGIERALYELRIKGRERSQKGIILITDGIVDTGDAAKDRELTQWLKEDLTNQSRDLDVRIFGIALTDAADFSLLQTLATRTDGEYFRTYEAAQISSVLQEIRSKLAPPTPAPGPTPQSTSARQAPQASSKPSAQPKVPQTDTPTALGKSEKEPAVERTMVVVEKSTWIKTTLAIIVAIVLGIALTFFLILQYSKRRAGMPVGPIRKQKIPEAHLDDLTNACETREGVLKIEKEHVKIGRGKSNDIIINQPAVSGFHATIEYRNLSFYLEDQRSTNGTKLNGRKLEPNEPVRLKSGDEIVFSKIPFKFFLADTNPFGDTVMLSMTALTEKDAEATIVLDLDAGDSKEGLISCMQSHLIQIHDLGKKYRDYVNAYFAPDILGQLADVAHKNLILTTKDEQQHCTPVIKNQTFYLTCSLPVTIAAAAAWYGSRDNGFSQFVLKWLKSKEYTEANCHQLCVITFGQDPATWVSITIVPTHSEPDPVEIMSVDFLNDEEKASMALDYDHHGRVV